MNFNTVFSMFFVVALLHVFYNAVAAQDAGFEIAESFVESVPSSQHEDDYEYGVEPRLLGKKKVPVYGKTHNYYEKYPVYYKAPPAKSHPVHHKGKVPEKVHTPVYKSYPTHDKSYEVNKASHNSLLYNSLVVAP